MPALSCRDAKVHRDILTRLRKGGGAYEINENPRCSDEDRGLRLTRTALEADRPIVVKPRRHLKKIDNSKEKR